MNLLRFALFFSVIFLVLGGASVYVHRHVSKRFDLGRRSRRVLFALLASGFAATVCTRLLARRVPSDLLEPLGVYGYTIVLFALVSATLLGLADLLQGLGTSVHRLVQRAAQRDDPPAPEQAPAARQQRAPVEDPPAPAEQPRAPVQDPPAPAEQPPAPVQDPPAPAQQPPGPVHESLAPAWSRRLFLAQAATGSALLIGGGSSAYGALFGRHDYEVAELPIRIPGLSPRLEGYTVVQLSDIHLGLFVDEPEMNAAAALVQKARPDIIVLTGDLIDHDPRYTDLLGRLVRRLSGLARDGVVAIPGNHDYFTGIDETIACLTGAGATVLRNSGRVLGGSGGAFSLLGVDDVWAARRNPAAGPDIDRALRSVPTDLPRILLCHNPSYFPRAAGKVALQLSGHTHGGQFNLLVRPAEWLLPYGYVAGLYERDGAKLYVNRGFGTAGPPARVGSPPEVTRIVLVSG